MDGSDAAGAGRSNKRGVRSLDASLKRYFSHRYGRHVLAASGCNAQQRRVSLGKLLAMGSLLKLINR
jgi:hypothetical protein